MNDGAVYVVVALLVFIGGLLAVEIGLRIFDRLLKTKWTRRAPRRVLKRIGQV